MFAPAAEEPRVPVHEEVVEILEDGFEVYPENAAIVGLVCRLSPRPMIGGLGLSAPQP